MEKERLWKIAGSAQAWFYVRASTEALALHKVATGEYEDVQYEFPEAYCDEAFPVEEKLFLLSMNDDLDDEIDIQGHVVITEKELTDFYNALNHITYLYFPVTTNGAIEYKSSGAIRSVINVKEITKKQYEVLESLDMTNTGFAESLLERITNYKNYL